MSDAWDPVEVAAAEDLDAVIDAALVGVPSGDPVINRLVDAYAEAAPPWLAERVHRRAVVDDTRRARAWWPARIAAAVLALFLLGSGVTDIFFGQWLADAVRNPYAPHIYREGGLAFLAVGAVVAWAAVRPRWLEVAVMVGSPLGVLLAVNGAGEIIHLRTGALDHVPQLVSAVALAYFWWRARLRYRTDRTDEE